MCSRTKMNMSNIAVLANERKDDFNGLFPGLRFRFNQVKELKITTCKSPGLKRRQGKYAKRIITIPTSTHRHRWGRLKPIVVNSVRLAVGFATTLDRQMKNQLKARCD